MKRLLVVLWCFMPLASHALTENGTDSVEKTLQFINEMQTKLKFTKNPNIILVVGNTGSGKSTLVHYVAGDYSNLISIEPDGDDVEYTVYDGLDPETDEIVSTTKSRTLVPEMVIDEAGKVWYDCPGFADTRSQTMEISSTSLIKSVIENASNIKIVLVVNYASVTKSYDRFDLDRLLAHATQLIKTIDRYKNSVSLVVSKAPPKRIKEETVIDVHEDSVKRATAAFMREHRSILQSSGSNERKIQLIDALLEEAPNENYPKISIFWRPNVAGAFNTIPKLVDGRQKIRKSIIEGISYMEIQQDDFGFPLTDGAQIHIANMAEHIIFNISITLMNIDNHALSALQQDIQSIDSFHSRLELLATGKRSLQLLNNTEASLEHLIERFAVLIEALNITSINTEFRRIKQHEKNLNVLKSIARTEVTFPIRDMMANSSWTIDYLTTEHNWYSFLEEVYEYLARYDVQKDISTYNVANLSDWEVLNKPQGLQIDASNFNEFVNLFLRNSEVTQTPSKLKELNGIIEITLKSPPQYDCRGGMMSITGHFVKSSDIQPSKCWSHKITKITVFVSSIFYVDSDLNLNGFEDLMIFADKWKIMQPSAFKLNGFDGKSHNQPDSPGTPGRSGNAGSDAGNFFGLSNELIKGDSLTVNLNAGNGGDGQHGTGSTDVEPSLPWVKHEHTFRNGESPPTGSPITFYKQMLEAEGYDVNLIYTEMHNYLFTKKIKSTFEIFPKECCVNTGVRGPAGLGGRSGIYEFIQTGDNKANPPKFISLEGSPGRKGETGRPCKTSAIEVRIDTRIYNTLFVTYKSKLWIAKRYNYDKCSSRYVDTSARITYPRPRVPLKFTTSIIEYKTFLRKCMNMVPLAKAARKLYDAIELNPGISRTYGVADFVFELNALEKQFYELNEFVDFLPFYDNLLKRIESYTSANKGMISAINDEVLALLYTTILSKTASIRNGKNFDLIIDIENFFDLIIHNIEELDETTRIGVINAHRDTYNSDLKAKIDEANELITRDILPQIGKVFSALDFEMEKVTGETIALQKVTKKEIKTKQMNAKIIRRNAMIHKVNSIVYVLGMALSDCGARAYFRIAVGLSVDPKIDYLGIPTKVRNVQNALDEQLKANLRNKVDAFESELNKIANLREDVNVEEFDGKLNVLMMSLKSIKSKNPLVLDDVGKFFDQLSVFANEQQEKLAAVNGTAQMVQQLQKTANAIAVMETSVLMYLLTYGERLDAIGAAINADRGTLIALNELEDRIYAEFIPMIEAIQDNLVSLSRGSSMALDLLQWKVHDTLRSVRSILIGIEGFRNEYGVEDCLAKIDEVMNLIIKISDRIQNYQEQTKLATYLSDLQSADYRGLGGNDLQLSELQMNLQANIILTEYHRALDGFKQAVFPFAADFLDLYQLPATLPVENGISVAIASAAGENIKSLKKRIKELNSTVINESDEIIHNAYFDGDSVGNRPFYVWPNDQIQDQLQQLFAGKKIYLLADVKRGTQLNAVKFSIVGLHFRSSNQSTNERLEQILQSFHISMTHMGESSYRCNKQFYSISSRPQTIEYSFSKRNQEPMDRNIVYEKLRSGVKLLSPYALWALQLSKGPFDELKPFAEFVDIELHGNGQYISEGAAICNTNLKKYYSPREIL